MVTADGKWVTYENVKRKQTDVRESTTISCSSAPRLLNWTCTVKNLVDNRLEATNLANVQEIVFYDDNVIKNTINTSVVTRQNLRKLDWDAFMHQPYRPNVAPSDSYVFLSLAIDFSGEKIAPRKTSKHRLSQFLLEWHFEITFKVDKNFIITTSEVFHIFNKRGY